MADIDPFKDIAYGDLNPIVKKRAKYIEITKLIVSKS